VKPPSALSVTVPPSVVADVPPGAVAFAFPMVSPNPVIVAVVGLSLALTPVPANTVSVRCGDTG
jgi:hypothetical protein